MKPGIGIRIIGSKIMAKNRCDLQRWRAASGRRSPTFGASQPGLGGPSTARPHRFRKALAATIETITVAIMSTLLLRTSALAIVPPAVDGPSPSLAGRRPFAVVRLSARPPLPLLQRNPPTALFQRPLISCSGRGDTGSHIHGAALCDPIPSPGSEAK